jgi:ferritin-like metal-binding protein YciE
MNQAVQLLKQTLEEEKKKTDAALNKLAEAAINRKAARPASPICAHR